MERGQQAITDLSGWYKEILDVKDLKITGSNWIIKLFDVQISLIYRYCKGKNKGYFILILSFIN